MVYAFTQDVPIGPEMYQRIVDEIGLGADHHGRSGGERRIVCLQLGSQHRQVGGRILGGEIDHEHERAAPNDVPEEPMPEPLA